MTRKSRLAGVFCVPVGHRPTLVPITRRAFVGAGVLVPSLALAEHIGNSDAPDDWQGLRFVEDATGISVVKPSPFDPEAAKRKPYTPPPDTSRTWRIANKALGPKVTYRVRTLVGGAERGYALEAQSVSLGELRGVSHEFKFIRSASDWLVHLRTTLWNTPGRSAEALQSANIRFDCLCNDQQVFQDPATDVAQGHDGFARDSSFVFDVDGIQVAGAIDALFEGHFLVHGKVSLALDAHGTWHLRARPGGRLHAANVGFGLTDLEFAWCERDPGSTQDAAYDSANPGDSRDERGRGASDPFFCAASKAQARIDSLVMARATGMEVALSTAEPPTWTYMRRNWRAPDPSIEPGTIEMAAAWSVTVNPGRPHQFGPIDGCKGLLQAARDGANRLDIRFAGAMGPTVRTVQSRIGELSARGWSTDPADTASRTPRPSARMRFACTPRHDEAVAGGVVQTIDLPVLLLGSDLVPADVESGSLTFQPTTLHAIYDSDAAYARQTIDRLPAYLWLGDVAALQDHPIARIDLTRARLALSRTQALASLAFMFSGLQLELFHGEAWITDARNNCRVVEHDDPALAAAGAPLVQDVRPTLVVEFPPQHMFEECLFRPRPPDLPDVDVSAYPTFRVPAESDVSTAAAASAASAPAPASAASAASGALTLPVYLPTDETRLLRVLQATPNIDDRVAIRQAYRDFKSLHDDLAQARPGFVKFTDFALIFEDCAAQSNSPPTSAPSAASAASSVAPARPRTGVDGNARRRIPADQLIYIGPFGMDPDVMAIARGINLAEHRKTLHAYVEDLLDRINQLIPELIKEPPGGDPTKINTGLTGYLANWWTAAYRWLSSHAPDARGSDERSKLEFRKRIEQALSATIPEYSDFRDFYRSEMTALAVDPRYLEANYGGDKNLIRVPDDVPKAGDAQALEFFSSANRDLNTVLTNRQAAVALRYVDQIAQTLPLPESARARFANPSRLAFRVDCAPRKRRGRPDRPPSLSAKDAPAGAGRVAPGARLAFTFADLTDWSRFDMAVPPRAMQVPEFEEGGELVRVDATSMSATLDNHSRPKPAASSAAVAASAPAAGRPGREQPSGEAAETTEEVAMMRMLGMRAGAALTAQERLADVEASLRAAPTSLETAIEMPARLILSPSQRAQWRTPRDRFDGPDGLPPFAIPACLIGPPVPLWTAELLPSDPDPRLRAVHSPDLRPGFVRGGLEGALVLRQDPNAGKTDLVKSIHTPGVYAPPRGPRAPWTIGIEDADAATSALGALQAATGSPPCDTTTAVGIVPNAHSHPLVRYLCNHADDVAAYGAEGLFRTSLDAYDRHELVLLSSAWGLPVRGRRELNGQLQSANASSQVELPARWQPIDLEAGTAAYRPRSLQLQELRLSALGGFLRHDSDFIPPSAARHLAYGPLYDSLSIERWQHWIVLGRDVHAEVVYKGFLFPIGHRASLVKQTERIFLRGNIDGRIRAFLRQRMFIRIGQPDKTFPAIGQPNGGRQFPANLVRMLTLTSPDIVDPAQDRAASASLAPSPAGRLFADEAGLVFWPRTARIAGTEVAFEMQVEKAVTRTPLIFVDNVAANRPDLVGRLVAYYNNTATNKDDPATHIPTVPSPDIADTGLIAQRDVDAARDLRTLDFGGQAMRYCDELRPGASSHKTLYWTLKATGCVGSAPAKFHNLPDNGWEGQNNLYDDPSLEGADQPPFYPAVETARMRLDQVERMTGNGRQVAVAQFDGNYVANGFLKAPPTVDADGKPLPVTLGPDGKPKPTDPVDPTYGGDSLEIYLDIVNQVSMSMGLSGDRSGGVFRPDSELVGMTRQRGPLGGAFVAGLKPGQLFSLIGKYTPVLVQAPVTPVIPATPAAGGAAPEQSLSSKNVQTQAAFKSFFPGEECKILGVVTMKKLAEYVVADAASQALPLLQDVVQYTVAGVAAGEDVVRTQVIVPLRAAVTTIRAKWSSLEDTINQKSGALKIRVNDVFPDVDSALSDLEQALGVAVDTTDAAEFIGALAQVYECGRRLVDAFGRAIANPLDRIQSAFQRAFEALLPSIFDQISGFYEQLANAFGLPLDPSKLNCTKLAGAFANRVMGFTRSGSKPVNKTDAVPTLEFARFINLAMPVLETTVELQPAIHELEKFPGLARQAWQSTIEKAMCGDPGRVEDLANGFFRNVVEIARQCVEAAVVELDKQKNDKIVTPAKGLLRAKLDRLRMLATVELAQLAETIEYQSVPALIPLVRAAQSLQRSLKAEPQDAVKLLASAAQDIVAVFAPDKLSDAVRLSGDADKLVAHLAIVVRQMRVMQAQLAEVGKTPPDCASPTGPIDPGEGKLGFAGAVRGVAVGVGELLDKIAHRKFSPAVAPANVVAALEKLRDAARNQDCRLRESVENWARATDQFVYPPKSFQVSDPLKSMIGFRFDLMVAATVEAEATFDEMFVALKAVTDALWDQALLNLAPDIDAELLPVIQKLLTKALDVLVWLNRHLRDWADACKTLDATVSADVMAAVKQNEDAIDSARKLVQGAASVAALYKQKDSLVPKLGYDKTLPPQIANELVKTFDRRLLEFIEPWRQAVLARESDVRQWLSKTMAPVLFSNAFDLVDVYKKLRDARDTAWTSLDGTLAASGRDVLLVAAESAAIYKYDAKDLPSPYVLNDADDQLTMDVVSLTRLRDDAKDGTLFKEPELPVAYLSRFFKAWAAGASTPLRILQQLRNIATEVLRGELLKLIDFAALRDEIETEIKMLVPSRISTSYDFGLEVKTSAAAATGGIFVPKDGCKLTIHSTTSIDLLHGGATSFSCVGELGAFDIGLVGNSFKAATLHFSGVRFESSGGPTKCDLSYQGFTIEEQLKFIEDLSPFFGSPKGNGFYLVPLSEGLGIEAGYGLNLGTISLLDIAFFNVSINVAARLHFDKDPSTFVVSLSRRDAPFTIAVAPYGGSGFFALEADSSGIVGFEASFEYGGAGAFAYGPLTGQGRLMTGVYIRSSRHSTTIGASFYAGGSSSIWIFTFGASLSVTATQQGNTMVGNATYCFSFSMGIVDYDYHVAVRCTLQWSSGSGADTDGEGGDGDVGSGSDGIEDAVLVHRDDAPVSLAMAAGSRHASHATRTPAPAVAPAPAPAHASAPATRGDKPKSCDVKPPACRPERRVDTWCQADDWHAYHDYFAFDLAVDAGEFQ